MKTIRIVFSRARSKRAFFSSYLQWYMRKPYSHVCISFEETGLAMIYQASHTSVNAISAENFNSANEVVKVVELKVSQEVHYRLLRFCKRKLGFKYDVMQLIGIWVANTFKMNYAPIRGSNKAYVCSEFVAELLEALGYKIDKDLNLVMPSDVEQYLEQH